MIKQQIRVKVTTKFGFSITADDAVVSGQGTAAYSALTACRDLYIADGTDRTIVPYHAIDYAEITPTQVTVTDPDDSACVVTP